MHPGRFNEEVKVQRVADSDDSQGGGGRDPGHAIDAQACDNGPEFISQAFTDWCKEHDIEIRFIQPGKPDQNAFIERFNRSYREEVLDAYLYSSIADVQEITDDWLRRYNEIRPHDSLGNLPPALYREKLLATVSPV